MGSSIHHQAWDLPLTIKHGIFHSPPSMGSSIDHQAWDLPLTIKHGIFHSPPSMGSSIDHQAWDLSLTTKHGSTFTSLLLLFKRRARMIGGSLSCLGDNFHAIFICSTSFSRRQIMMSLRRGRRK
jgi:hypothetical protein